MKLLIAAVAIFSGMSCAYAHQPKRHNHNQHAVQHQTSNVHYVYIRAHRLNGVWVEGHWQRRPGVDPHENMRGWHRVAGHWVGTGRNRVWVNTHWERTRRCHHPRR